MDHGGNGGDASFKALDEQSDVTVGPEALLLIGFAEGENGAVADLLKSVGAAAHETVNCTTTMGSWTVQRALAGGDGGTLLPVDRVPRVMLLAGMTDRQVNGFIDGYASTGLPRPIFAVATESNLEFGVAQLLEDLLAERRAMQEMSGRD